MSQDALSARQDRFLSALLVEPSITAAAKVTKTPEGTARRWLQEPDFKAAYRVARSQVTEQATVLLQRAAVAAVGTLMRNLKCGNPSVEVKAAQVILEMTYRASELEDLTARIDDLEAQSDPTGRHRYT